jgi:hypothetical protein
MLLTTASSFWRERLKASALHLLLSLAIAMLAALLVFVVWYPYPYREISSGRELFLIVVTVDVVLGPLITLVVFNRSKPWSELRRDLAWVVLIQVAALSYGLWTVAVARPVHMVFEFDRFRVVHAIDIPPELLAKTPAAVDALPITGPTLLAVRPFHDSAEEGDATLAALKGVALSARPDLWQPYADAIPRILRAARPATNLKDRFPLRATDIDRVLEAAGRNPQTTVYLPMVGRKSFWTVFLDPATAQIVTTMPLDSF